MQSIKLKKLITNLKKLDINNLRSLCQDIRTFLLQSLNETGGHLASNLGIVELSVALHYCFNLPQDKLIWDVSHQSYVHKILSGRVTEFNKLRQQGGISGYTNPIESSHDQFMSGHAGTSVPNSLGMEIANQMTNKNERVLCVVGDASFQIGANLEALNYLGQVPNNLTIILNDNGMSISKTVGSFMKYMQDQFEKKTAKLFNISVKKMFEKLNISYVGPINGHNISELISALKKIKRKNSAHLIHIKTKKGLGYKKALVAPSNYHKVSRGFLETDKNNNGNNKKKPQQFTQSFSEHLITLASKDPSVVAISAAMQDGTGVTKFSKKFPDRCFDVGICEQLAVSMAAGLAKSSFKPVVAIYSTFLQRAYDQVFHDVCLNKLPVIFVMDRAGVVGEDGPTHHGLYDISFLRHLPEMVLISPRDGLELKEMLKFAINLSKPVAIRYPVDAAEQKDIKIPLTKLSLGKPEILSLGEDVAFLGYGNMSWECLHASMALEKHGISSTVVNARFAKPINSQFINNLFARHKMVISVEDHAITGGFGSAVRETISEKNNTPFYNLGYPDKFIEHAKRRTLLDSYGLTASKLSDFTLQKLNVSKIKKIPRALVQIEKKKEIILAKTAGFCMGVERALNSTLKIAKENRNNGNLPIHTLGPLIHNKHVIEYLENQNIRAVSGIDNIQKGIIIIRAHGIGPAIRNSIKKQHLKICDATCPKVKKVQMIVKSHAEQGYAIIIFGDKTHAEVVGVLGYAESNSYVVGNIFETGSLPKNLTKVCLVSQTTQNLEEFNQVTKLITSQFPSAKVFNTICSSTSERQKEVKELSKKVDAIVVIGDKNSGNTIRLMQISQRTGISTYHAETPNEITEQKFARFNKIGITAGASTPMWIIDGVVKKLKKITTNKLQMTTEFQNINNNLLEI